MSIDTEAYKLRGTLEHMLDVVEAHEGKGLGEVTTQTVPRPLCLDIGLDWICDVEGGAISKTSNKDSYQSQIALCQSCLLQEDCLEGAMERNENFGIWGGLMPKQRARLRKQRTKTTRR